VNEWDESEETVGGTLTHTGYFATLDGPSGH
jgi:hypothetical protein